MTRLVLAWSGGKDSAWALQCLRGRADIEVAALFTTFDPGEDRVPLQGIRRDLIEAQADAIGLPLDLLPLPHPASNARYEALMRDYFATIRRLGIDAVAYGDLFLADIRAYRERLLDGTGLEGLFPLWATPTAALSRTMIDAGLDAIVTSVDLARLPAKLAGCRYNLAFLDEIPDDVDPCGEYGEFHTLVRSGPMFRDGIDVEAGGTWARDGFGYRDFLLAGPDGSRLKEQ